MVGRVTRRGRLLERIRALEKLNAEEAFTAGYLVGRREASGFCDAASAWAVWRAAKEEVSTEPTVVATVISKMTGDSYELRRVGETLLCTCTPFMLSREPRRCKHIDAYREAQCAGS